MAEVRVSGTIVKIFGASNQGLLLQERYTVANSQEYSRSWNVWFNGGHGLSENSTVTVSGQLAVKIEDYDDRDGNKRRRIRLDINNANLE